MIELQVTVIEVQTQNISILMVNHNGGVCYNYDLLCFVFFTCIKNTA